ncbi:MAG: carbamoyl phosphate synthase large subunit [Catenulispora sp.]|nr:carbamoyl phosphate synthase large subunit [Catenulispora sp.]
MPRRADISSVLVTGSGPVQAGRGREFDQAGVQACRALRRQGVRVVLVNPDPATVMADSADATYPEPVTPEAVARVIEIERPDAWLATVGGPAGLGAAVTLDEAGLLDEHGVELIGATIATIGVAADGERIRRIVGGLGLGLSVELGLELGDDHGRGRGVGAGWREFDLRVLRDRVDEVMVCSIERFESADGDGLDGVEIAPALTLSGRQYRLMRLAAVQIARAAGVNDGGCTVRFAIEPGTGRMAVVGMNPAEDGSSAIASMALGVPLARIAAELALGYTLAELTGCGADRAHVFHEPSPGHVVVRVRPLTPYGSGADGGIAVGRSFQEALRRARRSRDSDPWFPTPIWESEIRSGRPAGVRSLDPRTLRDLKAAGFSDARIARVRAGSEREIRELRRQLGVRPAFHRVDACASRLRGYPPYLYATYGPAPREPGPDTAADPRPTVFNVGSGADGGDRGQHFDHACAQAASALAGAGYRTVAVGCDPHLVSADRCYLGALTAEHVLDVVDAERRAGSVAGAIVQLGGREALGMAGLLEEFGVPIAGASFAALQTAVDRTEIETVLTAAGYAVARYGTARSRPEAARIAARFGYPVSVRPPDVFGVDDAEIVLDVEALAPCLADRERGQVLIEPFLENSVEFDVDALYDGRELFVGGVTEHIGPVGDRFGRPVCTAPPVTVGRDDMDRARAAVEVIAEKSGLRGLFNVRFALRAGTLYVLEVNPGASRTLPFLSNATRTPLAGAAARIMLGEEIESLRAAGLLPAAGDHGQPRSDAPVAVRETVFPLDGFPGPGGWGTDTAFGPRVRFAGEVMGVGASFAAAYARARAAAHGPLPLGGRVLASIADRDKRAAVFPLKKLANLGFEIRATAETASVLRRHGVGVETDREPGVVDRIRDGEVDLIVNTVSAGRGGRESTWDGPTLHAAAVKRGVPYLATIDALAAAVQGIEAAIRGEVDVQPVELCVSAGGEGGDRYRRDSRPP